MKAVFYYSLKKDLSKRYTATLDFPHLDPLEVERTWNELIKGKKIHRWFTDIEGVYTESLKKKEEGTESAAPYKQ